jgi:surface antigen
MAGAWVRLALAAAIAFEVAGCASEPDNAFSPQTESHVGAIEKPRSPLQCVPYARQKTGIPIYGDAYTWWDKAAGKFERGTAPKLGAVMVLSGYAGPNRAHLAVVRNLVSEREIKIDHANWLDDGQIYVDDPVIDVSQANDWSLVRVWNIRASAWGSRSYPVQGFIGPGPDNGAGAIASLIAKTAGQTAEADNPQVFSSR